MDALLTSIDEIKNKITSQEYINLMSNLQRVRDISKGYTKCEITYLKAIERMDEHLENCCNLIYVKHKMIINLAEQNEHLRLNDIEGLNDYMGNSFNIDNGILDFTPDKTYFNIPEYVLKTDDFSILYNDMIFLKAKLINLN